MRGKLGSKKGEKEILGPPSPSAPLSSLCSASRSAVCTRPRPTRVPSCPRRDPDTPRGVISRCGPPLRGRPARRGEAQAAGAQTPHPARLPGDPRAASSPPGPARGPCGCSCPGTRASLFCQKALLPERNVNEGKLGNADFIHPESGIWVGGWGIKQWLLKKKTKS